MNNAGTARLVLDVLALILGGGLVALFTVRSKNRLTNAQADDAKAAGTARILDAAGRIVEHQADLVPTFVERVANLEAAATARAREVDELRRRLDEAMDRTAAADARAGNAELRAAAAEARATAMESELRSLYAYIDDATRWMHQAVELIRRLDGEMPAPPAPPRGWRGPITIAAGDSAPVVYAPVGAAASGSQSGSESTSSGDGDPAATHITI